MNLTTLFDKLLKYGTELNRPADDEEGDKNKKKIIALKVTNIKDMES